MTNPSISIIMNCLNCAGDLPEALASVKTQTFQNYEIIFWDNGSTDKSPEIARQFGPRLRYFRAEKTTPLGGARNLAIAKARGEYIAFLDCDDLWRPTKLEKQLQVFAENTRVGLVCTDTEIFNGKRILSRVFAGARPQRGMVYAGLLQRQWISMSSAMIRREALNSALPDIGPNESQACAWFDENLNVCEEADLFYRIAYGWEVDYINEPLTLWRVHGDNTTFRKFSQFSDETLAILKKHQALYPDYYAARPDLVELLTRRAAFQKAVALWREGHNGEARKTIKPWLDKSHKYRLFNAATYLPGSFFDIAAKLYFALPSRWRA